MGDETGRRGPQRWRVDPIGILRAMRRAGLTNVAELSRLSGVSRATLNNWLSEQFTHGWAKKIRSVAKVLGVGPSELTK